MYLLNTQATVDWILATTLNTVVSADINIIIVNPNGDFSFIANQSFLAPTDIEPGLVTHLLTPDTEGLWEITLVKGPAETYTPLSKATLYVFDTETVVNPLSYSDGSLEII